MRGRKSMMGVFKSLSVHRPERHNQGFDVLKPVVGLNRRCGLRTLSLLILSGRCNSNTKHLIMERQMQRMA